MTYRPGSRNAAQEKVDAEGRRQRGRITAGLVAGALLCCWAAAPGSMADGQANAPGIWIPNVQNTNRENPEPSPELSAKQLRALNEQRQKQIVADTERLLHLAQELNRELDGSSDVSADEEMRKMGQIEKLARSVKEKMRDAVTAGPAVEIPQGLWRH